jgi:hypothetical protein
LVVGQGLGKTVEVLALVLSHRSPDAATAIAAAVAAEKDNSAASRRGRLNCVCDPKTAAARPKREADLVQCASCGWMLHRQCVNYDPSSEYSWWVQGGAASPPYHCSRCTAFATEPPLSVPATLIVRHLSIHSLDKW